MTLRIESLSYGGGRGVGRAADGMVVFVPFAAPGDLVEVRILHKKKNFAEGEIVRILEASSHRQPAPCSVFGECGGCVWQHIEYGEQLVQKQSFIDRALKPYKDLIEPIQPSPKPLFYRNRIQLHRKGDQIGFLKRGSNDLVPIEKCWIAEDALNKAIPEVLMDKPFERRGELALTQEGKVTLREGEKDPEAVLFSQVNTLQNENLIRTVVEWAKELHNSLRFTEVWDLYAGSGNLTFPLFEALKLPCVGVELSQHSTEEGRRRLLRAHQIQFIASSVEDFLKSAPKQTLRNALIVLDPPREGLSKSIVEILTQSQPKGLILVGCHLMNFSRDLSRLSEGGFKIDKIRPLDMFPQTDHVEMIARALSS